MEKPLKIMRTLIHLKPAQLAFFILRRKFPARRIEYDSIPQRNEGFQFSPGLAITDVGVGGQAFNFLNIRKHFVGKVDWSPDDVPRLWRYNLHYFDYLRQANRPNKLSMILDWVARNPQGSQPGWEPFTASLRIVNWVIFLAGRKRESSVALQSLFTQALWLEKNDERHILANHYFENLKALVFAGSFFQGEDAQRWLRKAKQGLLKQLEEQTLSDGGHYERTPQYHSLMLENYLDIYNLAKHNPQLFDNHFITTFEQACRTGLQFLSQIEFVDGGLPLFNDTAFAISPSFLQLNNYFADLGGVKLRPPTGSRIIHLPASGIYGYANNDDMLVIDAGDIGPKYQPGHSHCDMLSFEWMLAGERVFVDTGVCEYEPGHRRHYLRSTRAHNTVSVNGLEQSEVWGEFRVARRAKILNATISRVRDQVTFSGAYRGFYQGRSTAEHTREIVLGLTRQGGTRELKIKDTVKASGSHAKVETYFHLHPEVTIDKNSPQSLLLRTPKGTCVLFTYCGNVELRVEDGIYCPEFGKVVANKTLVFFANSASLPFRAFYSLHVRYAYEDSIFVSLLPTRSQRTSDADLRTCEEVGGDGP